MSTSNEPPLTKPRYEAKPPGIQELYLLDVDAGSTVTLKTASGSTWYVTVTKSKRLTMLDGWMKGLSVMTDSRVSQLNKIDITDPNELLGEVTIKVGQQWRCANVHTSVVTRITVD